MEIKSNSDGVKLWTARDVVEWSTTFLSQAGSPSARLDAEVLLTHVFGCERIKLYMDWQRPLSVDERGQYRDLIKRRSLGEPVAYLVGYKYFWRHQFAVDKRVLIPRPDSETIIETVLAAVQSQRIASPKRILDIGTGSGCLAISLAAEFPEASVTAWDVCPRALMIAEQNALKIGCDNRIHFERRSCFDIYAGPAFDIIVSNPPYIGQHEILSSSVVNFEPHGALFADEGGYAFYQHFAQMADHWLEPRGMMICEVGHQQAENVAALFQQHQWTPVDLIQDLAGIGRVVVAQRNDA